MNIIAGAKCKSGHEVRDLQEKMAQKFFPVLVSNFKRAKNDEIRRKNKRSGNKKDDPIERKIAKLNHES